MRRIRGGSYQPLYGERDTPIEVGPFELDTYLVTNGAFLRFVADHPRWRRDQVAAIVADRAYLSHWGGSLQLGPAAPERAPVTNVSWFAARAYCKAQGKRLPTLDEWELAARAVADEAVASDSSVDRLVLDWYATPTRLPLPEVGRGFRNHWGVWDMHGLVWEWVLDFNAVLTTGESRKDAAGVDRELFCAAGSIGSVDPKEYATFLRYALRSSVEARHAVQNLGFRCARDVEGESQVSP